MSKNLFRLRLIFFSVSLSLVTSGITVLVLVLSQTGFRWTAVIAAFLLTLPAYYFLFDYLYSRLIFKPLSSLFEKILSIRQLPAGHVRSFYGDGAIIISEINRLVQEWSSSSEEEIGHLKQVENYRRDFLSNVSHELKTPIFSIQGFVHTLLDGGIDDPEVNLYYLRKASLSIDRLISMVEDLEAISRLESGELQIDWRTFDLVELIREICDSLEVLAKDKSIRLGFEDEPSKPVYVYADRDMIRQILVNLLVNSVKYGKKDGSTRVQITETDQKVILDIKDDGIGIAKEHIPRLFERFYRVDKSRSREQGGTGLGLAIVKHIIEAHNERISVNSEPGKGTTFTFSLKRMK